MGFPGSSACNLPASRRPWFNSWIGKIPWRRDRLPTPIFCPEEFHGLYSSWDCEESDTTERISLSLYWNTAAPICFYKQTSFQGQQQSCGRDHMAYRLLSVWPFVKKSFPTAVLNQRASPVARILGLEPAWPHCTSLWGSHGLMDG